MSDADDLKAILDSLRRIVRELRVFSRRAELDSGLSAAQLFVLERMSAHRSLSVNALAEQTLTHQSSVSVVAQRLEERGLITRQTSPVDGRRKELSITEAGRRVLKRAPVSLQDRLMAAGMAMAAKDREELARLLSLLVKGLNLQDSPPALFFEQDVQEMSSPASTAHPCTRKTAKRGK
jgi:DNA-binding MarR family transcriptional regulator